MIPPYRQQEIEVLLKSSDSSTVIEALMELCFNSDDPNWIQEKCLQAITHGLCDDVKGLAITCLGHLARMQGSVDKMKVLPVLEKQLKSATLAGRAQDALDDIAMFTRDNYSEK